MGEDFGFNGVSQREDPLVVLVIVLLHREKHVLSMEFDVLPTPLFVVSPSYDIFTLSLYNRWPLDFLNIEGNAFVVKYFHNFPS